VRELTSVLTRPETVREYGSTELNRLLSQARRASMMAKLDACLHDAQLVPTLPAVAQAVLEGSRVYVAYLQRRLDFELSALARSTADLPFPIVLLKGAAYFAAQNPAARGRGVRDIDILVARKHLPALEARLQQHGWRPKDNLSSYDDHYYRDLSHELPPLRHPEHDFELDVHHNVLPPVHRLSADIEAFLAAAVPLDDWPFHVPAGPDQLIHSAIHLTLGDDFQSGLRDLHDISLLAGELARSGIGAGQILERAAALGITQATADALNACARHFGDIMGTDDGPCDRAGTLPRRLMAWAIDQTVFNDAPDGNVASAAARAVIWWRAQYLRMPVRTLISHALRKSLQRSPPEVSLP
jgi:hypothetical protein